QWAATAKVAELEQRYPDLLQKAAGTVETVAPAAPSAVLQTSETLQSAVDVAAVIKAAQAIAREVDLERLLDRLMRVALENAGAERGQLILERAEGPVVRVVGSFERIEVRAEEARPLSESADLPVSLIQYVRRTRENVVIGDAPVDERCANDPYVVREQP